MVTRSKSKAAKMEMPKKLKTLTSRILKFTGPMAYAWLQQDQKIRKKTKRSNRKLTPSNVKNKLEHMINGTFVLTSQGITIDWDGAVIDGQHTLHAVTQYYQHCEVQGEKAEPVQLFVTEGENPAHFPFYDQGKTRSAEDVFGIEGHENPKDLSGAMRLVWIRLMGKKVAGAGKKSPYELLKMAEDHPELQKSVTWIKEFGTDKRGPDSISCKSTMSVPYAAGLHYLMLNADGVETEEDKKQVNQFWEEVIEKEGKKGTATYQLHKKIQKIKDDPNSKMSRDALVDMTIQAFNQFFDDPNSKARLKNYNSSMPYMLGGLDGSLDPNVEEELDAA